MAESKGIIDWEEVGKTTNLAEAIRFLPAEVVVQALGSEDELLQAVLTRISRERLQEMLHHSQPLEAAPPPTLE